MKYFLCHIHIPTDQTGVLIIYWFASIHYDTIIFVYLNIKYKLTCKIIEKIYNQSDLLINLLVLNWIFYSMEIYLSKKKFYCEGKKVLGFFYYVLKIVVKIER